MCKFGNVRSILKTTFTLSVPSEIIAITRITAQTHCLLILIHSATNRRCFEEVTYGNVTIPKDMTVHLNMADLHYNPDLWGAHSPELFVPERYFSIDSYFRFITTCASYKNNYRRECICVANAQHKVIIFCKSHPFNCY